MKFEFRVRWFVFAFGLQIKIRQHPVRAGTDIRATSCRQFVFYNRDGHFVRTRFSYDKITRTLCVSTILKPITYCRARDFYARHGILRRAATGGLVWTRPKTKSRKIHRFISFAWRTNVYLFLKFFFLGYDARCTYLLVYNTRINVCVCARISQSCAIRKRQPCPGTSQRVWQGRPQARTQTAPSCP